MKKLLLPLLLIIALPALAQETEYRITSQKSIDCDNETLFAYNSSGSINPSCVKEIIDLWGKENIDSLFYDADGKIISRDYYEYYEGETEHIAHAEYFYNEQGLKTNVKYFDGDGYRQELSEEVFFYYNDNNQMIRMEYSIDGVVEEKYEYSYNDKGLMLEEIAYEDYGWGFTSYEKTKFYYEENYLVKEEYYIYMETDWDLYAYNEYEYDNGNCITELTYYYGEVYNKVEYTHDLNINAEYVYTFSDPDNDYLPVPTHVNMITGFSEYVPGYESHELELSCVYDFTYEELGVSVMELSLSSNIYPNPVEDILNVEAENIDLVELYDIYGRKLYSEEKSDNVRIDMNNFSSGVYFVKIYSEGKSSVEKIMKK